MTRRASGILLPIASLPSPFGIGDLGPRAYRFAEALCETKQGFWQVLPLNPTTPVRGNSPYSTLSAFAGNPLLISPESLVKEGHLSRRHVEGSPPPSSERIDYPAVTRYKRNLLHRAYQNFKHKVNRDCDFDLFCHDQSQWLEDYALFVALKGYFRGLRWNQWPSPIRNRDSNQFNEMRRKLAEEIDLEKFQQYLFFKEWFALKRHLNHRGIQIIGDFPLYVDSDSPDVWANPEIFRLDAHGNPSVVSGIPPDYFSATGQLWGNPLYRWDVLKENEYAWWVSRIAHNLMLFDIIRLDHFKGYVNYWEVPAGEPTAVKGRWVKGPGAGLFSVLLKHFPHLPFIAEDLGVITTEVCELRDQFEIPGMRVLQFAFGRDPLAEEYKPFNYIRNCVAYTGTHDNDTLLGWLYGKRKNDSTRKASEIETERENALRYLGYKTGKKKDAHWEFIRLLMMSAAQLVIIPLQDILGLGTEARMNRPGRARGNWKWRLAPGRLTTSHKERLLELTSIYGRAL